MKHSQVWTKDLGTDIYEADVQSDKNLYLNILGVVNQGLVV